MPDVATLLADLAAESAELDALVADLDDAGWHTPTPAQGWDVQDAIVHLMATDTAGLVAIAGGDLVAAAPGFLEPRWDGTGEALLTAWRAGREQLAAAVSTLPAGSRIGWYGPPMGQVSFLTARLMETWAHGQDVADGLGVRRTATARIRHVVDLGVRTRGWSYVNRGLTPPEVGVSVELSAPDGDVWSFGPAHAPESITGSALDFALLVTQRRHRDDLALVATGASAQDWLTVAQAFAGPPGPGRLPA